MMESVATTVVTELIMLVINYARTAKRCAIECEKLRKELEIIRPDVEQIEGQLGKLRDLTGQGLKMVDEWLARLKVSLDLARIDVHKCATAGKVATKMGVVFDYRLSRQITAQYEDITKLASDRLSTHLHLTQLLNVEESKRAAQANSVESPKWHKSPLESKILRQRMAEVDLIKQREAETRRRMSDQGAAGGGGHYDRRHTIATSQYHVAAPLPGQFGHLHSSASHPPYDRWHH